MNYSNLGNFDNKGHSAKLCGIKTVTITVNDFSQSNTFCCLSIQHHLQTDDLRHAYRDVWK